MDVVKILGELRAYKEQLEEAIATLEHLARNRSSDGRKPRSVRSLATRRRMALAQRKRWAAYHKNRAKLHVVKKTKKTAASKGMAKSN